MRGTALYAAAILCGSLCGAGIGAWRFAGVDASDVVKEHAVAGSPAPPVASAASGSAPKVVAAETQHDFGGVEAETTNVHPFVVRNAGTGTLKLSLGGTTCAKCTVGTLTKDELGPGESTTIEVSYHASVAPGPFSQSAILLTNDPVRPRLELGVKGRVTVATKLAPDRLTFASITAGEEHRGAVRLISFRDEGVRLLSHQFVGERPELFELETRPLEKADLTEEAAVAGLLLKVTVKPGLPLGAFRQRIRLETDRPGGEPLELPIEGRVVSDISLAGAGWNEERGVLTLGAVSSATGAERRLVMVIRGKDRKGIEFKVERCEPEYLQAEIGPETEINQGKTVSRSLIVRVAQGAPRADHSGSSAGSRGWILLSTTHPAAKEIKLQVSFTVEP